MAAKGRGHSRTEQTERLVEKSFFQQASTLPRFGMASIQGMRPNANQLGKVLKKPGILRSSEIREAWQEVLREFDSHR